MRNFWSLAVLGFAIAGGNYFLIPDVWAFQSQPAAVNLVSRQAEGQGADVVPELTGESENGEVTNKQTVSSFPSLLWDFNNLP